MQPGSDVLRGVRYEDLLRAIGHYIDAHTITDVVLTQIPEGVLLKGTVIERHGADTAWWKLLKPSGSVPIITLPEVVTRGRPWESVIRDVPK